ncbi:hypothetical protein P775_12890 [Puniceibacterium antarcticum]|uniref:Uncharacterized protein n=1 Tax=Puniceibacterium antarcticum TaxID=1206336 RepID=A0A2G8RFC6_9RHOB|nr:TIGR03982 family His-Xaa-Ser system protein [Puniceibacterium antarcticum]PIL19778.1 hypothetical protein P775_12890 [Puniceibacterium antarcticum]
MRLASSLTSFLFGIIAGIFLAFSVMPLWKLCVMQIAQDRFGDLTFKCDDAMRGHLMAKQKLVGTPSKANADALKSAEIGLLDCQDYDLMRKRLTRWGLTDNELSEMSLLAIEEKGADLRDVVRIHEIRY